MGRWPPRPPRSKFIKRKCWICNGFVRGARIVEYGPVAAKAVQEQMDSYRDLCNKVASFSSSFTLSI